MIIRLTRARVARGREGDVFETLRGLASGIGRPDGMEVLLLGRRNIGPEIFLTAITAWRDMDALQAAVGPTWARASFAPVLDELLLDATVEHYESVVEAFEELHRLGEAPE